MFLQRVANGQDTSATVPASSSEVKKPACTNEQVGRTSPATAIANGQRRQRNGRGGKKNTVESALPKASRAQQSSSTAGQAVKSAARSSNGKPNPSSKAAAVESASHPAVPVACSPLASALPKPDELQEGTGRSRKTVSVSSGNHPATSTIGGSPKLHAVQASLLEASASSVHQLAVLPPSVSRSPAVLSQFDQPQSSLTTSDHMLLQPSAHVDQAVSGSTPDKLNHAPLSDIHRNGYASAAMYSSPVSAGYPGRTFSATSSRKLHPFFL